MVARIDMQTKLPTIVTLFMLSHVGMMTAACDMSTHRQTKVSWETLDYRRYNETLRENDADYVPPAALGICGDSVNPSCSR